MRICKKCDKPFRQNALLCNSCRIEENKIKEEFDWEGKDLMPINELNEKLGDPRKIYSKQYYKKNKNDILARNKKWIESNKNHHNLLRKKWKELHPDKVFESSKKWFLKLLQKYQENGFEFESIDELNFAKWYWGTLVKDRDNHICQRCNSKLNIKAHHIIPVKRDIKKSLDPNNGISLCAKCHDPGSPGSIHNLFKIEYSVNDFWDWFESYNSEFVEEKRIQSAIDKFI
ncbi:HNH endonuclease [Methanobacterium spitsbergense]|uniref:HNH endonuclease n=1 Tax=Methanobacterium spitsbergense TaxID=2874285 RepID=A0A8T5UWV4_9EURY|nr:HNH endonuclease [Methanobacterium spitsbergense]MBZ2166376.1 HNH endonuclease [Methanobacterium spitsbergense]